MACAPSPRPSPTRGEGNERHGKSRGNISGLLSLLHSHGFGYRDLPLKGVAAMGMAYACAIRTPTTSYMSLRAQAPRTERGVECVCQISLARGCDANAGQGGAGDGSRIGNRVCYGAAVRGGGRTGGVRGHEWRGGTGDSANN